MPFVTNVILYTKDNISGKYKSITMSRRENDDNKKATKTITFNGNIKEFPSFKSTLYAELDMITAHESQKAAYMAVQPGKADTVKYVVDLVDLLEGKMTRPETPRPTREASTSPTQEEHFRIKQLELANFDMGEKKLKAILTQSMPRQWTKMNGENLRLKAVSETWKTILKRFELKTTDTLSITFRNAIARTPFKERTVDQLFDHNNALFQEANNTFATFMKDEPNGPHVLFTKSFMSMMSLSAQSNTDYNHMMVTPSHVACDEAARTKMKAYYGVAKLTWNETSASGKPPKRNRDDSTPINHVLVDPTRVVKERKDGGQHDNHGGGRRKFLKSSALPLGPHRDATHITCRFCKHKGHFKDESDDKRQAGCPYLHKWYPIFDRMKREGATQATIDKALEVHQRAAQRDIPAEQQKKTLIAAVRAARGRTSDDGGWTRGNRRAARRAKAKASELQRTIKRLNISGDAESDNDIDENHERREFTEKARRLVATSHRDALRQEKVGDDQLIWTAPENLGPEEGQLVSDDETMALENPWVDQRVINQQGPRVTTPSEFATEMDLEDMDLVDMDLSAMPMDNVTELLKIIPTNSVREESLSDDKITNTHWCIDSGAGKSVCNRKEWLRWTRQDDKGHHLVFPNGEGAFVRTEGLASLTFLNKHPLQNSSVDIPNVLLSEDVEICILAESTLLIDLQFQLEVSKSGRTKTYRRGEQCIEAIMIKGAYFASAEPCRIETLHFRVNQFQALSYDNIVTNMRRHHLRLGHLRPQLLAKLIANGRLQDIPGLDEKTALQILDKTMECMPCIKNKTTRRSYKGTVGARSTIRCHTLHMDTKGPFSIQGCFNASYGYKHLLVITDDATSMKWIYFLKELRDAPPRIIELVKYLNYQYSDTPVRRLRADGASVLKEGRVNAFCVKTGIKQEFSHPHSQEENGAPERYNRTLMETARTLLSTANVADYLWPEAAAYANDMLNRRPTKRTAPQSPHEVFGLGIPNANAAFTFGSIGFCHIPVLTRHDKTLAPRMHKCKFLGYSHEYKGYKVYDMTSDRVRHTRDFRVHSNSEDEMIKHAFGFHPNMVDDDMTFGAWPHTSSMPDTNPQGCRSGGAGDTGNQTLDKQQDDDTTLPKSAIKRQGSTLVPNEDTKRPRKVGLKGRVDRRIQFNKVVNRDDGLQTKLSTKTLDDKDINSDDTDAKPTERTTRSKYAAAQVKNTPLVLRPRGRKDLERRYKAQIKDMNQAKAASRKTVKTADHEILINAFLEQDSQQNSTKKTVRLKVPSTYKEAMKSHQVELWEEAIQKEIKSLIEKETWKTTTLPKGRKALPCKWVFDIKYNADGSIEKYKARLVIKGFRQVYGRDYDETFAPVARYESLKIVLAMATILDMEVHQMDVCTAFLNGKLEEEIYMVEPEGHTTGQTNVCKLLKSLYGLKQAGRIWYQLLHSFLVKNGFRRCHKEYCIYILKDDDSTTIIVVYVDDLTIASTSIDRVNSIKKTLSKRFEMKDLGEINYLLKIEIKRDRKNRKMTLSQHKYIEDLIQRFDMNDAPTHLTPQVPNEKLVGTDMTPTQVQAQGYKYPELVGALLHLTRGTRPDIANAVRTLSKFLLNHDKTHWTAALRVLKYLKGTSTYGLVFDGSLDKKITYQLYSDASFANTDENRHSVTGYCVMMAGGPVSTKTTKQGNVTISTTEAELVACSEACRESEWIWFLLEELGFKQTEPVTVHCDNTAVVAIAKNPGNHNGTKHIEIRHLYIRHLVDQRRANIKYCWTEDMIADILTKAISTRLFLKLRHMLGVKKIGGSGSVDITIQDTTDD